MLTIGAAGLVRKGAHAWQVRWSSSYEGGQVMPIAALVSKEAFPNKKVVADVLCLASGLCLLCKEGKVEKQHKPWSMLVKVDVFLCDAASS